MLYSGVVYDAMMFDLKVDYNFVLRKEIKPIWNCKPVFGRVFTCGGDVVSSSDQINDDVRFDMFRYFSRECVQVIGSDGRGDHVAQFGDISGLLAKHYGAKAAIMDAPTRDSVALEKQGFPVFAAGTHPVDAYGQWQIVKFAVPIVMSGADGGDVVVYHGDYVFADADGVLIIRESIVNEVFAKAIVRKGQEDEVRNIIKGGGFDLNELRNNRRW